jgi:tetratricopeptide repeat protein
MQFGELLIRQGLATPEQVATALDRQSSEGGRLGTHLVAMGVLTVDQLLTLLRGQQEADAALELCERTLQRTQLIYGPNHPNTHRAQYNLGRALLAAGRPAEAAPHAEAARVGLEKALGNDHTWTLESAQLLATAHHVVSRVKAASSIPAS